MGRVSLHYLQAYNAYKIDHNNNYHHHNNIYNNNKDINHIYTKSIIYSVNPRTDTIQHNRHRGNRYN